MNRSVGRLLAVTLVLAWAAAGHAGLTPAQKCEKLKNRAAAKRALCVAVQRGKEIAGAPFNYLACTNKMATAFATYETNGMGACPTTGDAADVDARVNSIFNPSRGIPRALSGTRLVDNGDGTVSDTQTGLMWEKKDALDETVDYSNPHDADNTYEWSLTPSAYEVPSGDVFVDFLYKLNSCTFDGSTYAGGFAGHCD